jgi:hypothetical protein
MQEFIHALGLAQEFAGVHTRLWIGAGVGRSMKEFIHALGLAQEFAGVHTRPWIGAGVRKSHQTRALPQQHATKARDMDFY